MTIGEFTYENGSLTGPALYMEEQGDAYLERVLAGEAAGFNAMLACAPVGCDTVRLVLVALQTDYAGWRGKRELLARLR